MISQRAQNLQPSATLKVTGRAKELKEHRTRERSKRFARGFFSAIGHRLPYGTKGLPRSGVGRCAKEVVLRAPTPTSRDPV